MVAVNFADVVGSECVKKLEDVDKGQSREVLRVIP